MLYNKQGSSPANALKALRLYPQLPLNLRYAVNATVIPRGGGPDGRSPVLIPKGCGIGWSAYHLHRSQEIYGNDAKVYRPERWETGELIKKAGLGSGFLDFHGGPRTCLGSKSHFACVILRTPTLLIRKRGFRPYGGQLCHH